MNNNNHYRQGKVETIKKIEDILEHLEYEIKSIEGVFLFNMFKYFDRAGLKEDYNKDIYKCADYANMLINREWLNNNKGEDDMK